MRGRMGNGFGWARRLGDGLSRTEGLHHGCRGAGRLCYRLHRPGRLGECRGSAEGLYNRPRRADRLGDGRGSTEGLCDRPRGAGRLEADRASMEGLPDEERGADRLSRGAGRLSRGAGRLSRGAGSLGGRRGCLGSESCGAGGGGPLSGFDFVREQLGGSAGGGGLDWLGGPAGHGRVESPLGESPGLGPSGCT